MCVSVSEGEREQEREEECVWGKSRPFLIDLVKASTPVFHTDCSTAEFYFEELLLLEGDYS